MRRALVRAAGGLGVAAVLAWATAAAGADDRQGDPGVRACQYATAGGLGEDPVEVGRLAAGSAEPAVALSGGRLRDAGSVGEVVAASAQLTRVCRAWLAR